MFVFINCGSFFINLGIIDKGDIMRKTIYNIVEVKKKGVYNIFVSSIALISLIPLMSKGEQESFAVMERYAWAVLAADYIIRFSVADYITGKGKRGFLIYLFTPGAVLDIICLMPMGHIFRVFRIFKVIVNADFFKSVVKIYNIVKGVLYRTIFIAGGYIFIAALFMFNAERESFENFFEALYWAVISLTTVGSNIYPKTVAGRIVSMISSAAGIAVVALPSAVITGGIISEIVKNNEES